MFVDVLDHFLVVLDFLSQREFGYMILIWGSPKFVLMITKSHQETPLQAHRHDDRDLQKPGPHRAVQTSLPASKMLQLVSQLYAAAVGFLQGFIIHLKHGPVRRVLGNLPRPFDVEFGRLVARRFCGFEIEASCHEELTSKFKTTSSLASLVFQMVQQRPAALQTENWAIKSFAAANSSLPKLWDLSLSLVRHLGGLIVYSSIGPVGQEEFSIVAKFVQLCHEWEHPPISVVVIHPLHKDFVHTDTGDSHADDDRRDEIWRRVQDSIKPATMTTYNVHIRPLMESIFDMYLGDPPGTEVDARRAVVQLFEPVFGWKEA